MNIANPTPTFLLKGHRLLKDSLSLRYRNSIAPTLLRRALDLQVARADELVTELLAEQDAQLLATSRVSGVPALD